MRTAEDTRGKRARIVLLVSNALLVVAALIVTSPWTSGLYTRLAQRRLAASIAPASNGRPKGVRAGGRVDGGEREWRGAADGAALGTLEIAKLRMRITVVKGVRDADLRRGPGWVPSTSAPGSGNCGIAGHRTTYLGPFRDIDRLDEGDEIVLETRRQRYTYRVFQRFFVARDDSDILAPTAEPMLTLTSCHPPYSDQFRIVVQARLAGVERR